MQHWLTNMTMRYALLALLALVICFLPGMIDSALAQGTITSYTFGTSFTCFHGIPIGHLYIGPGCDGDPSEGQIFSQFVCEFENIIQEVLAKVYCGVVNAARAPIMAALTLMIAVFGVALLMGISPFTAKELAILGTKFCLVLAFALEAEYMIGIGYALFMSVAKEGIIIVLSHLFQGQSFTHGGDVYRFFDDMVREIIGLASEGTNPDNKCENAIFAMVVLMAAVMPPVFFIAVYFIFRMLWVILRAVFGYCQGILGVTFLITLAPIYVGFLLFKPTRTLFDKWVQYLISFSFQMVIVFAFLGMVFSIVRQMSDETRSYTDLVKPYDREYRSAGLAMPWNACGICELEETGPREAPRCKEGSDKVLHPTELVKDEKFLNFITVKIISMILIFYLLDVLMDFVPQMARYLAGPKYAGQIGGGSTGGVSEVDVSMPGEKLLNTVNAGFIDGFARGGVMGNTAGSVVSGFVTAAEYGIAGGPQRDANGNPTDPGAVDIFGQWLGNPNRY